MIPALGHTFKPAATEARQVLEKVLREEPTHEGAIHLYIHLLEAGDEAGLAQPFAEQLARRFTIILPFLVICAPISTDRL